MPRYDWRQPSRGRGGTRAAKVPTWMKNDRPWFKAFTTLLLDDPRLGHLAADHALTYLQLYALCARDGDGSCLPGSLKDFAWRLHRSSEFMGAALGVLEGADLIAVTPASVTILDWDAQQPEISDAERQRLSRRRKALINPTLN